MLELYVRKTPRARKAYDCFLCGLPIPKGEKHVYEKGKWEGEFFTRRLHSACSNMVDFHLDETGSSEFTEDGVVETVREYICPYCPEKENCKLWPSWVPRCEEVVKEFTDECDACGKRSPDKRGEQAGMEQKCVVKDGSVVPCKLLDNVTEDLFTRVTKGVFELQISTLSTGESHTKGFGVKSGKHKKRGIMFNYCPFCGEDIGSHLRG